MFRKSVGLSLVLVGTFVYFIYAFHVRIRPEDAPVYKKMMQISHELRSKNALERHPIEQFRQKVQKDIWTLNEHYQIQSSESQLIVKQKKDKFEAIEYLKNINGQIEDKEQLRTFSALNGIYQIPTQNFIADNCNLVFFKMPDRTFNGAAIADTITYNPIDKTVLLSTIAPKKVLFWQEGLRMSAPEVLLHQDKIEGLGHVHFTFTLEEQNTIDNLFGKYL
jgi:hypothetical protein